jgi:hypothetical protein
MTGDDERDDQHEQREHSNGSSHLRAICRRRHAEHRHHRRDQNDERQDRHCSDDEAIAAELEHLLAQDGHDPFEAHEAASTSSSVSSR